MARYISPCVPVLATLVEATGAEYPDGMGVSTATNRSSLCVELRIHPLPNGQMAIAHLNNLDAIDEVVSDLLAARADLVKLMGGK